MYGYLCHHRCWQTASLVARDMLSAPGSGGSGAGGNSGGGGGGGFDSKQIREMERRQEIHKVRRRSA